MSKYQAMCPVCGAFGAPEIFLAEAIKREAIAKALRMPAPLAMQIQVYIGMFRPAHRGHSIDRVEKLLAELLEPIEAGRVRRNGRDWPTTDELWKAALSQVIERRDRLTLPLKDHGYLFSIVAGESDKAAAVAERQREEQLKHKPKIGPRDTGMASGYDAAAASLREMERMKEAIDRRKAQEQGSET